MKSKHDVIVVGAGPAGLAAAYTLAKAGVDVVVFERGEYPGTKNMFGGIFYAKELNELLPEFWKKAPVERHVTQFGLSFLTEEASFSLDLRERCEAEHHHIGFTVLRSKFDRWFADQAASAGALIVPGTVVDDVLLEGDRVVGVQARRPKGKLHANIVIAADGVNATLARQAGLRGDFEPHQMAVGVKELLALPEKSIQERFGLNGGEGAAHEFIGLSTQGVQGGGFLYTNRDSLSVGVVAQIASLKASGKKITSMLEDFKAHPLIRGFLRDSTLLEYSAHMIPEAGLNMMPKLYRAGMMVAGDAAAFVVKAGPASGGANYAVTSGFLAAETAKEALGRGDFSATMLATYQERLSQSAVLKNLHTFKRAPHFLSNPRIYRTYPELIIDIARKVFVVDGKPKQRMWHTVREALRGRVSLLELAKDIWKGIRAL